MGTDTELGYSEHRRILRRILSVYDSRIVRGYVVARFLIINIDMIHVLLLCLRGKRRILEVGCGFGLFGCYFAMRNPRLQYHGVDVNPRRIELARLAAQRLGLTNVRFEVGDARQAIAMEPEYDAILMMDLLHHLPDEGKLRLLGDVIGRLGQNGRLVVKDVTRRPAWKLFFTWALDAIMTRSFDMWYWDPHQVRSAVPQAFAMEVYPVSDVLPYPHVVYLFEREADGWTG